MKYEEAKKYRKEVESAIILKLWDCSASFLWHTC